MSFGHVNINKELCARPLASKKLLPGMVIIDFACVVVGFKKPGTEE